MHRNAVRLILNVSIVICETFQKQLYLITLCVSFSSSLCVFPLTSCDSEYLSYYPSYVGFSEICLSVTAATVDSDSSRLALASYTCLARVLGIELHVTLFACTWL